MSKGLEALHHPRIELASIDISAEGKHDIAYMPFYKTKQYAVIEKELKALEIINEKNVDVLRIKITSSVEQYNYRKIKGCRNLTNEEYGLLKEIIL